MEITVEERLKDFKERIKDLSVFINEEKLKSEIQELEKVMTEPGFWDDKDKAQETTSALSEKKSLLTPYEELMSAFTDYEELFIIINEEDDEDHLKELNSDLNEFENDLASFELKTKLNGKFDKSHAIVNVNAGAGGTESCDWAGMLIRMLQRWADTKGYQIETTDILAGEEAGIKNATFIIKGLNAFGYLKSETGVHRLVRISPFDSNKRRHTSFVSIDVTPVIDDDIDVEIKEEEIRVDTYRSSGAGGQHVNTTDSAVRITHLPTNIVVSCQNDRSQHKNRATAMKILKARLYDKIQKEKLAEQRSEYGDKQEIGWGSQIRSYVFTPYQMVKDHRTKAETSNVDAVMDGDIDLFIEAFLKNAPNN